MDANRRSLPSLEGRNFPANDRGTDRSGDSNRHLRSLQSETLWATNTPNGSKPDQVAASDSDTQARRRRCCGV